MVYILSPLDFCAEGERKFLLLKRMIEILHFISLTIFDEVFLILFSLHFVCVLLAGLSLLWGILCKSLSLSLSLTHTHTRKCYFWCVNMIWVTIHFLNRCASIRAIENNSNSDTKKLVTYWIVFSLISLFENAFLKYLVR